MEKMTCQDKRNLAMKSPLSLRIYPLHLESESIVSNTLFLNVSALTIFLINIKVLLLPLMSQNSYINLRSCKK